MPVPHGNIPTATLLAYDDGGHILLGHLQATREAVRAFLQELIASEGGRFTGPH